MKKSLRAASIVCALTLLASVTTACNNNAGSGDDKSSSTSKADSSSSKVSVEEAPEISWYVVGSGEPSNWKEDGKKTLDEYSVDKIGVKLDLHCISWGEWSEKRTQMLNSGEEFDIMFENNENFAKYVDYGSYADITDLLQSNAKTLYDNTDKMLWKGVTIDGKIYGVPTVKDNAQVQMFSFDASLIDATNMKSQMESVKTIQDLDPILSAMKEQLKKDGKDDYVFPLNKNDGFPGLMSTLYDGLGVGLPPIGVSISKNDAKVVNVLEQEDFLKDVKTVHEYYTKGYINSNANTVTESPKYKPVMSAQGWEGAQVNWAHDNNVEKYYTLRYRGPFITTDTIQGSINCIGNKSSKKTEAIKYLELINTDQTFRNMLAYGVEGVNWNFADDDKDTIIKTSVDWNLAAYTQGSFMLLYPQLTDEKDKETNPELAYQYNKTVKNYNEEALKNPSKLLGFIFDQTDYTTELANCKNAWEQYKSDLLTGAKNPDEIIPELNQKLKDNGLDTIMKGLQEQVDAYVAANS